MSRSKRPHTSGGEVGHQPGRCRFIPASTDGCRCPSCAASALLRSASAAGGPHAPTVVRPGVRREASPARRARVPQVVAGTITAKYRIGDVARLAMEVTAVSCSRHSSSARSAHRTPVLPAECGPVRRPRRVVQPARHRYLYRQRSVGLYRQRSVGLYCQRSGCLHPASQYRPRSVCLYPATRTTGGAPAEKKTAHSRLCRV